MKRSALAACILAGGLLSGCSTDPTAGDLTIFWSFLRHTATGTKVYDANRSPGGTSACAESRVEQVAVTTADGTPFDAAMPTIPCVWGDHQGAGFLSLEQGSYPMVITAYQTDPATSQPVATYETAVTLDVQAGVNNTYDVQLEALQQPIDVAAYLYDPVSQADLTCAAAGVDTVTYTLVDAAGTTISQSPPAGVPCGQPTVVFSGPLDLDAGYTVRIQGFDTASATPTVPVADSCSVPFDHFAPQAGAGQLHVDVAEPIPAGCR